MWRCASQPVQNLGKPEENGWLEDLTIDWIDKPYPDVKLLSTPERKEDEDEFDEGDEYDDDYNRDTEQDDMSIVVLSKMKVITVTANEMTS